MQRVFEYSMVNDGTFPRKRVDFPQFEKEIRNSAIRQALDTVGVSPNNPDNALITFKSDLAQQDIEVLEQVIFNHSAEGLPKSPTLVELSGPRTSDNKIIFLPNLFPGGVTLYLAGCGDGAATSQRGQGQPFFISTDSGPQDLEFGFCDPVYFAGGTLAWKGGAAGDALSLEARARATPWTPNLTASGNASLLPNGLIVPDTAGNHDVDLATAIPIPAFDGEDGAGVGYWQYEIPDNVGPGVLTPRPQRTGNAHLYAAPITLARFAARMPLLGDGALNLQLPAIKPKLMWPRWHFAARLEQAGSPHLVQASWVLMLARFQTV